MEYFPSCENTKPAELAPNCYTFSTWADAALTLASLTCPHGRTVDSELCHECLFDDYADTPLIAPELFTSTAESATLSTPSAWSDSTWTSSPSPQLIKAGLEFLDADDWEDEHPSRSGTNDWYSPSSNANHSELHRLESPSSDDLDFTQTNTDGTGKLYRPAHFPSYPPFPENVAAEATEKSNILGSIHHESAGAQHTPWINTTAKQEQGSEAQRSNDGGRVKVHQRPTSAPARGKKAKKITKVEAKVKTRNWWTPVYGRKRDGRLCYWKSTVVEIRGQKIRMMSLSDVPQKFRLYQREEDRCWVATDVKEMDEEERTAVTKKWRGYGDNKRGWTVVCPGGFARLRTLEELFDSLKE